MRCYVRCVRWATLVLLISLASCNDLRDFRGAWDGPRVGEVPALRVGAGDTATLAIDGIDAHGITARLAVTNLMDETAFTSLAGAEADVLANLSFSGAPLRVYLGFVAIPDAGGDALVIVALYDDRRIEVRLLRGGTLPIYAIYALTET